MKRNFFHIPSFVYKTETGASSGTPETTKPPEAPSASDVTRNNDHAEAGLKNAIAPTTPAHSDEKPKPPKPTPEEQARINQTVPALGEEDRRDFRVRRATPVMTNAPQATPRKVVKIDGTGNPVPSTQDTPPAPQSQEKKKEIPRFGPQGRIHASDNPPETQTTTPPQPPSQNSDTEYHTYHRPDGTQERVSRRFGGPWRTENGKGIIGQDENIRPEIPEPPKPETDKKRPFKPVETSKPAPTPEELTQRAHPTERENFNKLDFSGTTNPETTQGNAPSENTTTHPAPTNDANKVPPKPTTPEKNQSNRTFEEESADFQTRMERGEYHINNQFTDAGREHLRRVDALRPAAPATPRTEEKDKKIPETPAPTEPEKPQTPGKNEVPSHNRPGIPEQTPQPNTPAHPPESDKKDTKKPPEPNAPQSTEPVPRDAEEAQYLQKEKDFKKNLDSGRYTQHNAQGREEFTPEGRKAFRELTLTEHEYIPGAMFSQATHGEDSMPTDPTKREQALQAQEKHFFKNHEKHMELSQTLSETVPTRAERTGSQAKKHLVNGGEDNITFDAGKGMVSGDDPSLSAENWRNYDYAHRRDGYPKLTVFSEEKDIAGRPQFSGTVIHPRDPKAREIQETLDRGGAYPNLYTTQMDVDGDGRLQKVFIVPPSFRADGYAVSQSLGDAPVGPSKVVVLKEKKKNPPLEMETPY